MGKVNVVRFPERVHLFEAPLVPKIALAALHMDFDIIHVNGMSPTITDLAILFAKLRRKPVVVTHHNDAETHIWGRLGKLANYGYAYVARLALGLADVVVCTTASYAATSRSVRLRGEKLKIIPLGVNPARFKGVEAEGPAANQKRLLFVGQLKQYKGVHVLLEALARLRRDGHHVKLDVVGTGPEFGRLQAMVRDLSLDDHVAFRGDVDERELPNLYANCKAFVLPSLSRREAFGIVLLEALAAGKPVVATEIPGVKDVVNMAGGYLAKPNDPSSLADSILQALNTVDGSERYRGVAERLSWSSMADRYESVFTALTASPS